MGATPPPVQTVSHITVNIDGIADSGQMDQLLFSGCTPPDWSVEAPKHTFHGNDGIPTTIISSVQKPTYGTMTLTQGWDPNHVLAKWKYLIEQPGDIDSKKKAVTVVFLDSNKQALFQWHTDKGLLTSFNHSPSDASSNSPLTITATIDADSWELQDSGGSALQ
jgi:T4-like virus tail tube protein gp19